MSAAAAEDGEATLRHKTSTKKKKAKHGDVEVAPSKPPMPAAPFRETPPPESPAPGTPTLEEVTRRTKEQGKRKTREEQHAAARNPSLAMAMHNPSPPAAAQTAILGQEQQQVVTKKRKRRAPLPSEPTQTHSLQLQGTCRAPPQHDPAREEEAAAAMRTKERNMKTRMVMEQQLLAPSPAPSHTLVEGGVMSRKKTRKHQDQMSSPSLTAAVATPIFQQDAKGKNKQEQAPLPSIPGQIHLQETQAPPEQEPQAGGCKGKCTKHNNGRKYHVPVLSSRQLIPHQLLNRKEKPLPQGMRTFQYFVDNCTDSPPFTAYIEQFRCDPVRQDRKPALPRTPDSLAMLPPRGRPSVDSSQLTACEISGACTIKNSVASKTKQKMSGSGSASGSQEKLNVKIRKTTVMGTKKQRKKPPLLTSAEKRSDKYRRVPLDQLVPPPCSPHKLLQEKYASDPWKVIVICMFLNLTQGKQVRKIVDGFFERYPDPVSAFNADPKKMEAYLAPLGLQSVKTRNIQKLSKQYVEEDWKYVTELCGVGKYAADAYSIFCAGRATEVVPEDHKLVDYWKYVCLELPKMKEDLVNVEEAGVTEQNNVSLSVGESVACQNRSLG
ncbi:uncharacterized protein LOC100825070 isoform X2 [Brachypodium distachyon]|uniref:HhH-GPD domain-containing protein n=1 Tax=Brachypodium distachyon TaxID=15368 RepID=I1IVD5_BRADI|nr:uncharacterized protein LOC100825070 isoform X2 [Brachypodium distachyon]KQJ81382.1 hypothetical protein BRADI_5g00220v3 [Brachypodium distachyon]|eukprot:XP_003580913.1 uncharacterized protein LOC100825070 isoform X2 [Brachypodium distachyon]